MELGQDWIAVKSRSELTHLRKPELLDYAVELGNNFKVLTDKLFHPETGMIARLQSQIAVSARVNSVLSDRLLRLERNSNMNSQYMRKETIELHKFPSVEDVPDDKLEEKVLDIFNAVRKEDDEIYTASDFHACHRLKVKGRVIVKMTHRKRMRAVVKSRSKLANADIQRALKIGRVFIVESLAGTYKSLLYKCQRLKATKRIHDTWFFNGNINVVLQEKGERHHISHVIDILELLNISEDDLNDIIKVIT